MTLDIILVWHIHQPIFVPDSEIQTQCRESYQNLLRVHREKNAPFCFNITGSLLDRLLKLNPEFVSEVTALTDDGLLEPLASGYNHPLLPILPYESAVRHVKRDYESKRQIFDVEPTGFWPTDLGWTHWMVPLLCDLGIEWTVIDSPSLIKANSLPAWTSAEESGLSVLTPDVAAKTAVRELHMPYSTAFGERSLGVLLRDHERSVSLFGSELGGDGNGALYDVGQLNSFVEDLLSLDGDVVLLGEDGERLNPQTIRLYDELIDRIQDHGELRLRTGSEVFKETELSQPRFFPASTFQYDLRGWTYTMDDRSYLLFLDRVQRQVNALERRVGQQDVTARNHLDHAQDALIEAEDSGVLFWRYADRTRESGYEAAMRAYTHVMEGFDSL